MQVQLLPGALKYHSPFVYRHRTSAPHAEKAGSIPARAARQDDHVVELADTRRSERRALAALGVRLSPWSLTHCRRGRCPTGSHKAGLPGSIPGPATWKTCCGWASAHPGLISLDRRVRPPDPPRPGTQIGIAARSRASWGVGSTPTSVTGMIPWSNGEDAWVTTRKVLVRFQPGSLRKKWSVGVSAAHLLGKEDDRVQLPDGPLEARAAGPKGRRLVCTQAIGVRVPGGPLDEHGLMVQREDTRPAAWKSGFNSRSVH